MLTWTMLCCGGYVTCYVLHLMRDYPGSILIPCPRKDIKLSSWKCVVAEMAAPSWKFIAPKVLTHAYVHSCSLKVPLHLFLSKHLTGCCGVWNKLCCQTGALVSVH